MSPFLLIPSWVSLSILPFVAEILKRAICTCFSWICSFQDNNALLFCYAREILFSRLALSCSSSWHNGPFPPGNTLLSWLWWPSFLSSGFPPCFWILLRLVCKLLRFFCHHSSSVPANSQTSQTAHSPLETSYPHWFRLFPVLRTKPPEHGTRICLTLESVFHFPTKMIPHETMLFID